MKAFAEIEKSLGLTDELARLRKKYGQNYIGLANNTAQFTHELPVISTGFLSLDKALGIGGLPKGKIVELYGPESSGKTTLGLQLVANAQREEQSKVAAFIDVEKAVNLPYAGKLGVDLESLLLARPETAEETLETVMDLARSEKISMIIVDSVAAMVPVDEMDRDVGNPLVAKTAKLLSDNLKKLVNICDVSGTIVIFINQIRMKIGVMFGNPETTPGGRALPFYASIRLDVRAIAQLKVGDERIGNKGKIETKKNKLATPFRRCELDLIYGEGFSKEGDLLDLGIKHGIIKKAGAWHTYGDLRVGQGRENAKVFLRENLEIAKEIEEKILGGTMSPKEVPDAV